MKKEDPCWDGYEMIGTKKKNGKDVPNCVPKQKNEELTIDEMFSATFTDEPKDRSFKSLISEMYPNYDEEEELEVDSIDDIKYQLMSIINDASNILDHLNTEPPHWLRGHLGSIHQTLATASAFFVGEEEEDDDDYQDEEDSDYDFDVSEARKSTTEPAADHHYTLVNVPLKRRIGMGSVFKHEDAAHSYHKSQQEYSKDKDHYKNHVKVMSVGDAKKMGVPHSDFAGLKTSY